VLAAKAVYPDVHRLVFRLGEDVTGTTATLVAAYDRTGGLLWHVDRDGEMDGRVGGDRLSGCRGRQVRRSLPVHRRPRGQAPRRVRTTHSRHRSAGAAGGGRPVTPVRVPTHVGDLRWPVQAAVRVLAEPGDGPVEFVVVVD